MLMKFPEPQAELGAVDAIEVEQIANAQSSLPIKYDGNGNPLEPQPSADPHDPLNLPSWQKWPLMAVLAYWSFIGTMNLIIVVCRSPSERSTGGLRTDPFFQGPSFFELAENYHVSFTALAYTINGPLLAYGFGVRISYNTTLSDRGAQLTDDSGSRSVFSGSLSPMSGVSECHSWSRL
jgi:hypothetical protein